MSNLWSLFFSNSATKKAYEQYDQDDVDAAIIQELQFCVDDLTFAKIKKRINNIKEAVALEEEEATNEN